MTQSMSDVEKSVSVHTKKILRGWFVWLMGSLALVNLTIFLIFTWTNTFRDLVLSNLAIRNGTERFNWWLRPPVKAIYKIRLFNYTNFDEYQNKNADKLKVEEVGPYVYREILSRVNPVFYENGTVSYQEERKFVYLGGRDEDETLMLPNLSMLIAAAETRGYFDNIFWQSTINLGLSFIRRPNTIERNTAKNFIWGEESTLIEFFKYVGPFIGKNVPVDKIGLLTLRDGLSKDRITINTGEKDMKSLGLFDRVNGMKYRNVWGDKKCDKIDGTDGSMFPPHLISDSNTPLNVYSKDLCRVLSLHYEGHAYSDGMPTLRYRLSPDIFEATADKNSCYCHNSSEELKCPPKGIFNTSKCNFDSPFLTSFPHFYGGEESLFNHVDGLNPQKELHDSFLDVHPRLAVPMNGWSRLQINVEVRKDEKMAYLKEVDDGTILPLLWVEVGIEPFPDHMLALLHHAFYTLNAIEAVLQWGSLTCLIFFSWYLFRVFSTKKFRRPKALHRNISGQGPLIE